MRISVEKLVKKYMALLANPDTRNATKTKELKEFLVKHNYMEAYKKHFELSNKIIDLAVEKSNVEKIIKTVVDYRTKK